MEKDLTQELLNMVLPLCAKHQESIYSICTKSDCTKFLEAECPGCFEDSHPEHTNTYDKNLAYIMKTTNQLSTNLKQQQNEQLDKEFRNKFENLSNQFKTISKNCLQISETLQIFTEKLFNNNNKYKEQIQNILDQIANKEGDKEQKKFQEEISKLQYLLDFSDPKQLKLKEFFPKTNKSIQFLSEMDSKLKAMNEQLSLASQQLKISPMEISQQNSKFIIDDSKLLTLEHQKLFNEWLQNDNIKLSLLYRASRDGFAATVFHQKCDAKGPTLVFIQSDNDNVFGGYANQSWHSNGGYIADNEGKCFIFSLNKKTKFQVKDKQYAQQVNSSYGPIFGAAAICVADKCNENNSSYTVVSNHYDGPADQADKFLTGSKYFKANEIEVFLVN